jgi:hypothetical protein
MDEMGELLRKYHEGDLVLYFGQEARIERIEPRWGGVLLFIERAVNTFNSGFEKTRLWKLDQHQQVWISDDSMQCRALWQKRWLPLDRPVDGADFAGIVEREAMSCP